MGNPSLNAQKFFVSGVGIWVGMMLTVGILVPLTIFSYLTDKQVAGMVAGEIFKNAGYLNVISGVFFLVLANIFVKRDIHHYRFIRWLLLVIVLLTLFGSFVIQPWMVSIREGMLASGFPVLQSDQAALFKTLHGVSSSIYLIQLGLLGWVLFRTMRRLQ